MTTYYQAVSSLVGTENVKGGQTHGPISQITLLNDVDPPSEETIQAKLAELQAQYDSQQYQRDRASAYPSIQDVVVALAEKEEGDDSMWQEITAKRAKVKADNPKPE